MSQTKIEWCDKSWNPITGCSPVSPGCGPCYARRMANRLKGRYGYPKDDPFRVTFHPERLEEPLHWKKLSRIFVCSMGDLFHDNVLTRWIDNILEVIAACPQHTFLTLTKRPENIDKKFYGVSIFNPCRELGGGDYLQNLWLGVSAENQRTADERIPILLEIPAFKRFVSIEPMLEQIDISKYLCKGCPGCGTSDCWGLRWVICGGLSLPSGKIQPPKKEWVDSLIQQCDAAGVPIFIKPNAKYPVERKDFPYGSIWEQIK